MSTPHDLIMWARTAEIAILAGLPVPTFTQWLTHRVRFAR